MEYLIYIGILVCIFSILGISLNLVVGEAGLISVTHAAFAGIGGYASALLMLHTGVSFFVAVPAAMFITAAIAGVVGLIFARLREVYYVLGTVGFNVIAYSIMLNWDSLTRGPLGIPGIPRPELFSLHLIHNSSFFVLALLCTLFTFFISELLTRSSFGRVLHAIREDQDMTAVFGYSVLHYKVAVFAISAGFAALAGSLFASYITYIDPASFMVPESIFIISIIILGGLGSNRGAVLGACILVVAVEALRFVGFPADVAAQMRQVAYGLILIALMLYRPQGILGQFKI